MAPSFDLVDDAIDVVEAFEIKRNLLPWKVLCVLHDERVCWLTWWESFLVTVHVPDGFMRGRSFFSCAKSVCFYMFLLFSCRCEWMNHSFSTCPLDGLRWDHGIEYIHATTQLGARMLQGRGGKAWARPLNPAREVSCWLESVRAKYRYVEILVQKELGMKIYHTTHRMLWIEHYPWEYTFW